MSFISRSRSVAFSASAEMPAGDSGVMFTFAIVSMSPGAAALMIAFSR